MLKKILKIKKVILGLLSLLIMVLSYPLVEEILFITSKRLAPWGYDDHFSYKEILVSDFDNGDKLRNNMIDLAEKNNINIYFKDYEVSNPYYNSTYYYITSQEYLDKLPFINKMTFDEFNNSFNEFTNNDRTTPLDEISSKKFVESVRSFKNYESKGFLGQLLIFGTDENINSFCKEIKKLDDSKLKFVDFNPDRFKIGFSYIDIVVFSVQEFIKSLELETFVVLLLIIIAMDISSQKRKMTIYKLNGYTNFNIFSLFLKENIFIFILSSTLAIIPIIFLNQEVFNINSFKFLPYYFFIALIIALLIFMVTLISCNSLNKVNIIDTLYRKRDNKSFSIGFFILKIFIICILGLNLLDTLKAKESYDLYTTARLAYSNSHKDYYILNSRNFAAARQVYEAKEKAINEIIDRDGVLYYDLDYDANPNIVSANMNYINSLNLKSIDNKKINIDKKNKNRTYIVTKNSLDKLKENIKNSKIIYESRGLDTENPDIIVIDNIEIFPQINEYIHGIKPTDHFVITACYGDFLDSANLLFKPDNINTLQEDLFTIFDKYISTNLLKFEKEEDFYKNFEQEAKSNYDNSLKKLVLIILFYIIVSIYIFNLSFSDISKALAVKMLLGNPILNSSKNILLYNISLSLISVSAISYFLKFNFAIYLKLIFALIFLDLIAYIYNLIKYKNNLIPILKSSMEE